LSGHLKRERIVHDLEEEEKYCAVCAQDLREFGEETSERYEYVPAQLIVIEDVCKKYSCACTVKTAGKPSQPIEKSIASASLLTQDGGEVWRPSKPVASTSPDRGSWKWCHSLLTRTPFLAKCPSAGHP
jgi:hypothetical protein